MSVQGERLTYQWYKDDKKLESESATTESLVVRNPGVEHTGFYTVTVSNEAGSVHSARACMIVQLDPAQQASSRMKAASTGDAAGARAGRAASRRRRMLDGASIRGNTPSDSRASVPVDAVHDAGAPSLLTQRPHDSTEVEPDRAEMQDGEA
jgi:hypothetical protein